MKNKIIGISLLLAITAMHCTTNSTLLSDTAASLSPSTTSAATSSTDLTVKLRSIWLVGGTKTAGTPAVATAVGAFAGNLDYYDPTTNTWATITSASWTGTYTPKLAAAVAGYNGKIYVLGGFAEGGANSGTVQIYDIATSAWSAGTALGTNLAVTAATRVGTKIYMLNGTAAATATTAFASILTLNIYDIANDSWTTGANVSVTGVEGCAANDGFAIYKVSGKSAAATVGVSTTSYQYVNISGSPTTNLLFGAGATATAVTAAACVWLPETSTIPAKLLMLGGYSTITGSTGNLTPLLGTTTMTPSALVQSSSFPHSGPFSSIGTLPTATAYGAAVYTSSGVFFFGGNTSSAAAAAASSAPSTTVYASHPTLLFFQATLPLSTTAIPVMPTARWGHGAVVVQ
ncbi:MAG: hypothetical protein KF713_16620 [Turneriella sp.]|nr:hypothetical protein [Turneriella sp.]